MHEFCEVSLLLPRVSGYCSRLSSNLLSCYLLTKTMLIFCILHFGICHLSYCLWTRKTFLTCHIHHFSTYFFSICKSQKLLFLFPFFPPSSVTHKMYRRHNSLWTPNLRSISITNFFADVSFGQIGKERYVDKQCLYDH